MKDFVYFSRVPLMKVEPILDGRFCNDHWKISLLQKLSLKIDQLGLSCHRKTHTQRIDASIAHGIPMTYFETEGLVASFGGAARFFDRSKNELSFPNNEAVILVVMDGAYYGLHLQGKYHRHQRRQQSYN